MLLHRRCENDDICGRNNKFPSIAHTTNCKFNTDTRLNSAINNMLVHRRCENNDICGRNSKFPSIAHTKNCKFNTDTRLNSANSNMWPNLVHKRCENNYIGWRLTVKFGDRPICISSLKWCYENKRSRTGLWLAFQLIWSRNLWNVGLNVVESRKKLWKKASLRCDLLKHVTKWLKELTL